MGRFEHELRRFKSQRVGTPAGSISERFAHGFPGRCFIGLGQLSSCDFDYRTSDNLERAVGRLYGDLGDRVAKGIGSLAAVGRRRSDGYFVRWAALVNEGSRGQVELLMRERHRLRVAIGSPVLEPVTTHTARAHAATLACGRSPACTKKRCDNSSESPWAKRSHALSIVTRASPNRAGSPWDGRLWSSSARSNARRDWSRGRGLLIGLKPSRATNSWTSRLSSASWKHTAWGFDSSLTSRSRTGMSSGCRWDRAR